MRAHTAVQLIDKTRLGEYLGEPAVFNRAVLAAMLRLLKMAQQPFDIALRTFLAVFRLPGEAQKIDRIVMAFANQYVLDNPGIFANAGA